MGNNSGSKTIIIERMYAGQYLKDNIGHEIINTFKTDKGENYIYISPWGVIKPTHRNTEYVILVRLINQHCFEVLGYAGDLSLLLSDQSLKCDNQKNAGVIDSELQASIIEDNSIMYGGVRINELLSEQKNTVFVTFKAAKYRLANSSSKLYIVDRPELAVDDSHILVPDINFSKQSLHMYFDNQNKQAAYDVLKKIAETRKYWERTNTSESINPDKPANSTAGILDIIGKTDDELAHSNWIAYYLLNDKKLLESFVSMLLKTKDNIENFKLVREYHNVDIWLENNSYVIVIENKIKSGINGVNQKRHDNKSDGIESQLSKYIEFAKKEAQSRKPHFFIFLPDYSYKGEDLAPYLYNKQYTIVHYSELSKFFEQQSCSLPYYDDFKKALRKHATEYRKDLYKIMKDRFAAEVMARIQYRENKSKV